ncbi:hypothetical protein [Microbacterium sp. SLBN-146]|uniref:hypothetical protein n=1 Tax=Microbacterium sp. SLBN-146 TaxID=2768457 RepID=UPI00114D5C20|nr:hypothetical protein [Microbacterium sp. SLBN-146]
MDSTAPMDEWPQIGRVEVEPGSLDGPGVALTVLATELDIDIDESTRGEVPADGWRVIRRHPEGGVMFAAPVSADRTRWHVGSARPGTSQTFHVSPEPERLRPSRADRRGGLVLKWAPHMVDTGIPDDFVVEVVNEGDATWWPDGDSFHVVGVFTEPGRSDFSFGWAGMHRDGGVPLRPGEYARMRVDVNSGVWENIEPGTYNVQAVLVDLGIRADPPLTVTLTKDAIAARRHRHPSRRSARDERRMIEHDIQRLHAITLAAESLDIVLAAVRDAESADDAATALATALDCDQDVARLIVSSPLSKFNAVSRDRTAQRIAQAQRRIDAL